MKTKKTSILASILVAVNFFLMTSCSNQVLNKDEDSSIIFFAPTVSNETRAVYLNSDNLSSLGIIAYYTGASDFVWQKKSPNFMNNQLVRRVSGTSWVYSPTRYWPAASTDKVSFFAYAPHSSVLAQTDGSITLDTTADQPMLSVTVPSRQRNQADLLISYALLNKTSSSVSAGTLPLNFTHGLSSIDFSAQSTIGTISITSLKVYYTSTVKRSGKVSLSTGTWLSSSLQGSYSSIDGTTDARKDTIVLSTVSVGSTSTALTSSSNHLLIIPQALSAGDIKVDINYSVSGTAKTKTISLPAQTYLVGNNYTYLFAFGDSDQVYPIPLPTVPIGTSDMCGCTYDRVTNPHHDLSLPHYDANNPANNSWILRASADWESSLQFKNKVNFYIYGKYKVTSWWGSSSNSVLYVMPGGTLDLSAVSGLNNGMQIVNFGTLILPANFSINEGASLISATSLNASNTTLNTGGTLTLYGETYFNAISTYGSSIITINKCLTTNSLTLTNTAKAYVNSYLHTGSLTLNTTAKLYLGGQTLTVIDGDYSLDYSASFQILNESSSYAVFKCRNFISKIPVTSSMILGNIDIHGTIQNQSWLTTLTWDSRIKLNGNVSISSDGCRPAFP